MRKVIQPTPAQVQVAVHRGAYWMTRQRRDWFRRVDIESIDLSGQATIPPTMVLGRESTWDEDMDISRGRWLGLVFPGGAPATIEYANKCWKAEARSRLLKPRASTPMRVPRDPRPPKV